MGFKPVSIMGFFGIQATIENAYMKHVLDMIRSISQMDRTDKYSQQSLII